MLQALSRRGLHATAVEVGRLLYALNPTEDPRGALLYLEYLALRAKRFDLLDMLATARPDEAPLPGLAYSTALGKALAPGGAVPTGGPADEPLRRAVLMYPVVVTRLMHRLRVRRCFGSTCPCVSAAPPLDRIRV